MSELILKVLAGPNEGARARLHPDEEVTIGRDLGCDVILSDQTLAQTHVRLSSDGQSVRVTALEGAVLYVAGDLREALPDASAVECALFSPLKIGNSILIIAHGEEANWPLIDLDIVNAPKPENEAETKPDDGGKSADAAAPDSSGGAGVDGPDSSLDEGEVKNEGERIGPKRSGKKLWILCICAVAGVVLGLVFLFAKQDPAPVAVLSPAEKVTGLLQESGLDKSVTFEFDKNGGLLLSGFVKTSSELVDLRYLFSDAGYGPRIKVDVLDLQVRSLKMLLDRMEVNWQVQGNAQNGHIELMGYVPTELLQNQIVGVLRQDLPQLRPLDLHLITARSVKTDLEAKLDALKLGSPLQTVLQEENNIPRRMVVNGEVLPAEKRKLQEALDSFKQALYGRGPWGSVIRSMLDIRSQVTDKVVKKPVPPPLVVVEKKVKPVVAKTVPSRRLFGFNGIIYGDVAVAIGRNGKTYNVGDKLPNGYVVSKISDKGVVTKLGSKSKFYQIGKE